jgi:serine protease Do
MAASGRTFFDMRRAPPIRPRMPRPAFWRLPRRSGHAFAALFLAALIGCTVARPRDDMEKNLVPRDSPVFDKRFSKLYRQDLDLKHFWIEGVDPDKRDPVSISNKTFADAVDLVKDGVVNIYTRKVEEREARFGVSPNDLLPIKIPLVSSILEIIPFQVPIPFRTEGLSLGSGFIINDQGYIVTNAHVISNAADIRVILSEGRSERPAKIIGMDRLTDTALIKIDGDTPLSPIPLGDSDKLRVGEIVIAVGNPLGLRHSVTSGLVSAKERLMPGDGAQNRFLDFIQTDSAINPGSSGGPLLNLHGEVVGINTAIVNEAQLIGFAVPINILREVMGMLVLGKTERGWFGAAAAPLTPADGVELGYVGSRGVLVTEVAKKSPARKAGLRVKDIIVKINGQTVENFLFFRRKLLGLGPGQQIRFSVFRNGKRIEMAGVLESRSDES